MLLVSQQKRLGCILYFPSPNNKSNIWNYFDFRQWYHGEVYHWNWKQPKNRSRNKNVSLDGRPRTVRGSGRPPIPAWEKIVPLVLSCSSYFVAVTRVYFQFLQLERMACILFARRKWAIFQYDIVLHYIDESELVGIQCMCTRNRVEISDFFHCFTFKFWTSGVGGNETVFWQCGSVIWFEVLIIWALLFDIGLEFWDFILQKPKFSKPEAKSLLLQSN